MKLLQLTRKVENKLGCHFRALRLWWLKNKGKKLHQRGKHQRDITSS